MKFTAAGDAIIQRRIQSNFTGFDELAPFIEQGDASFFNLETTLHYEGECCSSQLSGGTYIRTNPEVLEDMNMGYDGVTTAYVTTVIRDTHMDGLDVKQGQYIGLSGKHLVVNGQDKMATAEALIKKLADPRQEIIMGFYGNGMTDAEIAGLQNTLQAAFPRTEIVFMDGQQDVYDLIISL